MDMQRTPVIILSSSESSESEIIVIALLLTRPRLALLPPVLPLSLSRLILGFTSTEAEAEDVLADEPGTGAT